MAKVAIANEGANGQSRTWQWVVNGWRTLLDKASHAITYFSPSDDDEPQASQRWGVLAIDVVENKDSIEVEMELPGMDKSDLSVEVINDHLVVSGHKKSSGTRRDGAMVITERAFGEFRRAVALPCAVDNAATKATYKNGILSVSLAKNPALVARTIPVTSK